VGDGEGMNATQPALALNLPPTPNPHGLFWCCGDCYPITKGGSSFAWQPPDYQTGRCRICGRSHRFGSRYGEDELVMELLSDEH